LPSGKGIDRAGSESAQLALHEGKNLISDRDYGDCEKAFAKLFEHAVALA
jgi:hypothetical protein